MTKNPNGCVVWEGNSMLNGEPIVLLLTGLETPSNNPKTGQMIQSWIIPQELPPVEAVKSGADASVCGDCPLRRKVCYVNLIPINQVWRKYKEGGYPECSLSILSRVKKRAKQLRVGSYGDPAAVPLQVWLDLLPFFSGHTGYTHQWRNLDSSIWGQFLMASCDTASDFVRASAEGWGTFRVVVEGAETLPTEILCPNTRDSDVTCEMCGLCSGNAGAKKPRHIINPVHGLDWKSKNFRELQEVL